MSGSMIHPGLALAFLAFGLAIAGVLLWPVTGLLWRALGALRANERVHIEDALKHLYDCEYRDTLGTLHSLAGALGLSPRRTVELIARLEAMELVAGAGSGIRLTAEGRRYALRVIRVHRLWERFLSDETGVRPAEWHVRADVREHTLSAAEADALSARMGYPRVDPHGDPIPTADGHIPPPKGQPLTELAVGDRAEIVHLEDEPTEVYAQLAAFYRQDPYARHLAAGLLPETTR